MYSTRYLWNSSGTRVTTIYCGLYSPEALVKARAYMENGRMVRSEHTTRYSPMVLALEVWDETKGTRIPQGVISQGESRRHFEAYVLREGLRVRHHRPTLPETP